MIDWKNINLDGWEVSLSLIEGLTFSQFILELDCNCPVVDEAAVLAQFEDDLQNKIEDAREVLRANLKNLVAHVKILREQDC